MGHPGSSFLLSVGPDGAVSGMARRGHASWALGKAGAPRGASVAAAAASAATPLGYLVVPSSAEMALPDFGCNTLHAPVPSRAARARTRAARLAAPQAATSRKLFQVSTAPPVLKFHAYMRAYLPALLPCSATRHIVGWLFACGRLGHRWLQLGWVRLALICQSLSHLAPAGAIWAPVPFHLSPPPLPSTPCCLPAVPSHPCN